MKRPTLFALAGASAGLVNGLFGGGGGAGVTITPVAFLVVKNGEVSVKYIAADDNAAERIVNLVPEMFDKVTGVIDKRKANTAE